MKALDRHLIEATTSEQSAPMGSLHGFVAALQIALALDESLERYGFGRLYPQAQNSGDASPEHCFDAVTQMTLLVHDELSADGCHELALHTSKCRVCWHTLLDTLTEHLGVDLAELSNTFGHDQQEATRSVFELRIDCSDRPLRSVENVGRPLLAPVSLCRSCMATRSRASTSLWPSE